VIRSVLASVVVGCVGVSGACAGDPGGDEPFVRDPSLNVELVSSPAEARSHETFNNCMECHSENGDGPGLFTAAGTVIFDDDSEPAVGAFVRFFLDPTGEALATVEVDQLGNFYTTAPLPIPEEQLFIQLESADGLRANAMPFPSRSLACNVCHTPGLRVQLHGEDHDDDGHEHD
jgi:hypothetical protein